MRFKGFVQQEFTIKTLLLSNIKKNIIIDITIDSPKPYLFFLFLIDPNGRLRVQFEGRRQNEKIVLGRENSCIGTYPDDFPDGEWQLYITNFGLIKENDNERIPYDIEVKIDGPVDNEKLTLIGDKRWVNYYTEQSLLTLIFDGNKKMDETRRWYRGDFHTHTTLSDGHLSPQEAVMFCEKNNIDYLFLTEHNLVHTGFEKSSTLFIPAVEITTLKGHLIVYGQRSYPDYFKYNQFDVEFMLNIINEAKKSGALVNIAHPMMKPWNWQFGNTLLKDIDLIEICNCPTWITAEEDNRRAIEILDLLWQDGHRIYGVGGSDNHLRPDENYEKANRPSLYADPSTWVYCNGLSEEELLKSVKKGRIWVARDITLEFEIKGKEHTYLPGDEVLENSILYRIKISNIREPLNINLIINGITVETRHIEKDGEVEFMLKWEKNDYNWARIGINGVSGEFVAYINPIMFRYRLR